MRPNFVLERLHRIPGLPAGHGSRWAASGHAGPCLPRETPKPRDLRPTRAQALTGWGISAPVSQRCFLLGSPQAQLQELAVPEPGRSESRTIKNPQPFSREEEIVASN